MNPDGSRVSWTPLVASTTETAKPSWAGSRSQMPSLGMNGRGYAQDALAEACALLDENPEAWTGANSAYSRMEGRVAVLEAALRELAYTDVVGDRARCVACKAWWSEYPPTQHEPGCFIGDALAGAVLAVGDAAPQTDNLGGDEVASSGGGS